MRVTHEYSEKTEKKLKCIVTYWDNGLLDLLITYTMIKS